MKVLVKWLKCPRQVYGIPRAAGTSCYIPGDLAKKIEKETPGFIQVLETEKPKPRRAQTRPVKREKED